VRPFRYIIVTIFCLTGYPYSCPRRPPVLFDFAPLVPRPEVVDADDQRSIFLNGHLAGRYPCDDKGTERVFVTQLAEVLPLPHRQIAAAFDLHPVTVSRFRALARQGGAAALLPLKPGPNGPSKMTPPLEARCRSLRADGLSLRAIAAQVSTPQKSISYVTVAALFQTEPVSLPQQDTLALEPPAPPETDTPPVQVARLGEQERSTRYAGAMLLFAALGRLDLWSVFQGLGATTGPARRFGWAQIVASIVFCFTLRFRSIEDWKNGLRRDLGVLIGEPSAPSVLSLRIQVKAWTESVDPMSFSRAMRNARKRVPALSGRGTGLGRTVLFGRPFLSLLRPAADDARMGCQAPVGGQGAQRRVYPRCPRTVVVLLFPTAERLAGSRHPRRRSRDSPRAWTGALHVGVRPGRLQRGNVPLLQAEGIGFITYLKGRGAKRRYASKQFQAGWFAFEGRRHSYKLFEKKTRLRGVGLLRTILFLGDEGQQIPVLTNLAPTAKPARVVHCLRLRWRQENSFKFLSENYAIDQIIQYGADPETQDRLIPNPKRKALKEEARSLAQQIQTLQAQLGRALEDNHEHQRPTCRKRSARGLKIAHADLRRQIAQQRQVLARVENRLRHTPSQISAQQRSNLARYSRVQLRHTPSQISAQQAGKTRSVLREDRRLLINALKLAGANAERMLALHLDRFYQNPKEVFSIFRGLLQLPGIVRHAGPDRVEVLLQRPGSPKVAEALQMLLADLNHQNPRWLHGGPILNFLLLDVNQTARPSDVNVR
jgi:hypothetical protein